ncbi:AraC family transcriptional regulator [Halomonas sp. SCS19]|uniref:AraC family transcriptional regulator n=1 Tax=Halomonas sp. SCS19 TaxID=2950870 RepID=UPI0032DFB8AE
MSRHKIKALVESKFHEDGVMETGVSGVQIFRVTEALHCTPAVYEPSVIAIVGGSKEAIVNGRRYVYDSSQYMCCPISLPVEAGTPAASPEDPLLGVSISLNTKVMKEIVIQVESTAAGAEKPRGDSLSQSVSLARWDDGFSEALLRLLQLGDSKTQTEVLGEGRLRELYYAVLMGDAGASARLAFGVGNEIARAIEYLQSRLDETVTIDEIVSYVGMSRAVFHRKFKQATTMSPIQFVKTMRLNSAAMKIATGMNVSEASMAVGYASASQFSREFKRLYGKSPKQWSQYQALARG